mgnify:CR=1 FL=1
MINGNESLVIPFDEIYDWCVTQLEHRDKSVTWSERCAYTAMINKLQELKQERKEENNGTTNN